MTVKIPDFDDMTKLADKIRTLTATKMLLDIKIKAREAEITRIMTNDVQYFQNGKPPSMSLIESTFQYAGLTGELLPMREELAVTISLLEEAKLSFEIYRMQLDLYRTEAANQRLTSI